MWKSRTTERDDSSSSDDDDWETDADFVNDTTEEEQRWGSKGVSGSGRPVENKRMSALIEGVSQDAAAETQAIAKEKSQYSRGCKIVHYVI